MKMVSKADEKGIENKLLYFLITTDSNIFAQSPHLQVKKQRYLNLVDSGRSMSIFVETATWANFERK